MNLLKKADTYHDVLLSLSGTITSGLMRCERKHGAMDWVKSEGLNAQFREVLGASTQAKRDYAAWGQTEHGMRSAASEALQVIYTTCLAKHLPYPVE